jgi:4'-phosphopantetheinyl transferase
VVRVFYTYDRELPDGLLDGWLRDLPPARQATLARLRQPHKRRRSLIGTRLLRAALLASGFGAPLSQLDYPENAKPVLPLPVDFSISHSGVLVACAVAAHGHVGLDVEMLRPMDAQAFRRLLTDEERAQAGTDPRRFFELWSRKEAVIKAWGRGGVWDMPKVRLRGSAATLDGHRWQLWPLALDAGYAAHLATDRKPAGILLQPVEVSELE